MILQMNHIIPNKGHNISLFKLAFSLMILSVSLQGNVLVNSNAEQVENKKIVVKPTGLNASRLHPKYWKFFLQPFDPEKPPIRMVSKYATWVGNLYQLSGRVVIVKKYITGRSQGAIYLKDRNVFKMHIGPEIKQYLPEDKKKKKKERLAWLKATVIIWDEDKKEFMAENKAILRIFPYTAAGKPAKEWSIKITGKRIKARTSLGEIEASGSALIEDKQGYGKGDLLIYYEKENLVKLSGTESKPARAHRREWDKPSKKWVEKNLEGKLILYDTVDESVFSE
ncbi:hypothetical protein ACFL35_03180 [Candidatus Riflebacteria bacterium]